MRSWDDNNRHGWLVLVAAHVVSVLCAVLRGCHHCRSRSITNHNIFQFNYVALLLSILTHVSTPQSQSWGTIGAMVWRWPSCFIVLSQSTSMFVVFCVCVRRLHPPGQNQQVPQVSFISLIVSVDVFQWIKDIVCAMYYFSSQLIVTSHQGN